MVDRQQEVVVRNASLADVRGLASVLNTIFSRDPGTAYVFGYPSRDTQPSHHREAVRCTLPLREASALRLFCKGSVYMLTAKVGEHVAGFAYWAPPKATKIPRSLHLRILGGILSVYDTIKSFIYPKWLQKLVNPAAYQENLERAERREKIMAIDGDIKSRRFPAELDEGTCWTLVALGVSEDFSRRGIGSKLVQWGCDRADEDDRAIYVSASQEGTHLYLKHGFDVIHHEAECLYDPQRGWVEQTYLIRWQKSRRVTKEKL